MAIGMCFESRYEAEADRTQIIDLVMTIPKAKYDSST